MNKMKKNLKNKVLKRMTYSASIVMGLMLSAVALTSCHDSDKDGDYGIDLNVDEIDFVPQPIADQFTTKYGKKAVVLGTDNTEFNASVVGRMTSVSDIISDDAQAFVFTKGYDMDFTVDEMAKMMKAYMNDACFIFVEPNLENLAKIEETAQKAAKQLVQEGVDVRQSYDFMERLDALKKLNIQDLYDDTEVLAFRKHDTYVIRDLEDMANVSGANTTCLLGSSDGKTGEKQCEQNDYEPTDYDRGESSDMLVDWMNEDYDGEAECISKFTKATSSAESTIESYMQGDRYVIQEQVGPSRALDKILTYELVYIVYSAYNFDTDTDYYFIRLRPNFNCSDLGCPTGAKSWIKVDKVVRFDDGSTSGEFFSSRENLWYGTYMSAFNFTGDIVCSDWSAAQNVTLLDASPKTDVSGSNGYSTGFSFSVSGNLGFNMSGPTGGASGGVSFSESTSHSIPDLQVRHSESGSTTKWMISGIVPQVHNNFWTGSRTHDLVGTFQRTDWQTEFTWIVSIKNPRSQTSEPFYLKATDLTEITDLNCNRFDYELKVHPTQTHYVKLPIPNRFRQSFIISCSDNGLQNVLKDQFSQTWRNEFTFYGKTDEEVEKGATNIFNTVKTAVNGYLDELVSKGYIGTYTFRLKTVDGKELSKFTLDNGKIVE